MTMFQILKNPALLLSDRMRPRASEQYRFSA